MLNEFNEVVELSDDTNIQDLFGNNNKNIELLEELLQVKIITRESHYLLQARKSLYSIRLPF